MLAKKYRLPVQSVFKKNGRTYANRYFLIKQFPAAQLYSRFGVAVPSRIAPKATARAALRRLAYRVAHAKLRRLPLADYLVIPKQPYEKQAADGMMNELTALFTTIHE